MGSESQHEEECGEEEEQEEEVSRIYEEYGRCRNPGPRRLGPTLTCVMIFLSDTTFVVLALNTKSFL